MKKNTRGELTPIDITPKLWAYKIRNTLELYTARDHCVAVLRRRDLKRILGYLPAPAEGERQ